MKKVTNATLGGIVFAVEEDAYEALSKYLKSIETKFANSPDYLEVSNDIESAIAEKFKLRKRNEKQAVTKTDVDEVVLEMGTADEVSEVADNVGGKGSADVTGSATNANDSSPKKRLYRNTDDSIISGVASGLAQYFDVDPVIVRVLFVVALFFNGFGLLAYIILWLIVPATKTTADKYAMRGENMTVADITERVKKNLKNDESIEHVKGGWGVVRGFLIKFFELIKALTRGILYLFRYILGIILVVIAALGVAGVVVATSLFWMPESSVLGPVADQISGSVMQEGGGIFFVIACVMALFIPLVIIIMLGVSLFAGRNLFTVTKSVSMFVVWIVSLAIVSSFAVHYGPKFISGAYSVTPSMLKDGVVRFEMVWDDDRSILIATEKNDGTVTDEEHLSGPKIEVYDDIAVYVASKKLDLSGQSLTGSLKSEIRHLSKLEYLNLSDNNFTGLPAEVGQLSKLKTLILKDNQFTGLPHELGNLKNLKYLDLSGNNISASDLVAISDNLPEDVVIVIE
jgi:phage shock protein PspC (stress-responsive transcriptional regulator)